MAFVRAIIINMTKLCCALLLCASLSAAPLAFPGAEGFGAETPGGRGGKILFVRNLNDAGPGSFREAVITKGPRIVVFRVSGLITLHSPIKITEPSFPDHRRADRSRRRHLLPRQ